MGKYLGNRLSAFEWISAVVWTVFWGVLGYVAITERSITLGGRFGTSHTEGLPAVIVGLCLLGIALIGIGALLRLHPFKQLLRGLLAAGWLCGAIAYLWLVYP